MKPLNNYLINIRKADYREKWSTHLNKRNNLGILQFALKSQNELRDVWRTLKEVKTDHFSQSCGDYLKKICRISHSSFGHCK
jgi:hypothetical protein